MIVRFEKEGKDHSEEIVRIYQTGRQITFFKYLVCFDFLVFFMSVLYAVLLGENV